MGDVATRIAQGPPQYRAETPARILTFDIERRPGVYLEWGPRNSGFMGRERQLIRSSTISWAAKWYGKEKVHYRAIKPCNSTFMQPEDTPGYRHMLEGLRDMLDKADIVVGYNSIRFDEAKVRGELARLGIREPSPFRSVDLMRTTKRMGWDYSSLAETLDAFGLGGKLSHQGFQLWKDFMAGDREAHETMKLYNIQDVVQTERAYDALRPWIKGHPNLGLWSGYDKDGRPIEVCHNCGKGALSLVPGKRARTAMTAYAMVECTPDKGGCGFRMRRNIVKERVALRPVR